MIFFLVVICLGWSGLAEGEALKTKQAFPFQQFVGNQVIAPTEQQGQFPDQQQGQFPLFPGQQQGQFPQFPGQQQGQLPQFPGQQQGQFPLFPGQQQGQVPQAPFFPQSSGEQGQLPQFPPQPFVPQQPGAQGGQFPIPAQFPVPAQFPQPPQFPTQQPGEQGQFPIPFPGQQQGTFPQFPQQPFLPEQGGQFPIPPQFSGQQGTFPQYPQQPFLPQQPGEQGQFPIPFPGQQQGTFPQFPQQPFLPEQGGQFPQPPQGFGQLFPQGSGEQQATPPLRASLTPPQVGTSSTTPIPIVKLDIKPNLGDGKYQYSYETGNGISVEENGVQKAVPGGEEGSPPEVGTVAGGRYSYTGSDGVSVSLEYTADENGFVARGTHIPTSPPISKEILAGLEENAAEEAALGPVSPAFRTYLSAPFLRRLDQH